jgi:hypothetical protein
LSVCFDICLPLQFAAWQLQIKDKDYDPLVHVAGFLNLAEFLPSPHRCVAQMKVKRDFRR